MAAEAEKSWNPSPLLLFELARRPAAKGSASLRNESWLEPLALPEPLPLLPRLDERGWLAPPLRNWNTSPNMSSSTVALLGDSSSPAPFKLAPRPPSSCPRSSILSLQARAPARSDPRDTARPCTLCTQCWHQRPPPTVTRSLARSRDPPCATPHQPPRAHPAALGCCWPRSFRPPTPGDAQPAARPPRTPRSFSQRSSTLPRTQSPFSLTLSFPARRLLAACSPPARRLTCSLACLFCALPALTSFLVSLCSPPLPKQQPKKLPTPSCGMKQKISSYQGPHPAQLDASHRDAHGHVGKRAARELAGVRGLLGGRRVFDGTVRIHLRGYILPLLAQKITSIHARPKSTQKSQSICGAPQFIHPFTSTCSTSTYWAKLDTRPTPPFATFNQP